MKASVKSTVQKLANELPDFIVREDELDHAPPPLHNPYLDYGALYGDNNASSVIGGGETALHFDEEYDENETEEEAKERQRKTLDGMFPNDGYDYSRHFRDPGEGVFIPASKNIYQPPQFAPKRGFEPQSLHNADSDDDDDDATPKYTLIGKASAISAALNQQPPPSQSSSSSQHDKNKDGNAGTMNQQGGSGGSGGISMKADIRTILVKGAKVLDDQLDPEIIAALESDDESDDDDNDDYDDSNSSKIVQVVNINEALADDDDEENDGDDLTLKKKKTTTTKATKSKKSKKAQVVVKADADDDYFDNMMRQLNEGGHVDEDGNEYFIDEEFEDEEFEYDDDDDGDYDYDDNGEYDDEYDDDVGGGMGGENANDKIEKQLRNREYFSQEKIDRLEARKQLNEQFDYLMREEYGDDDEHEMEKYENLRSTMDNVAERLEGDLLDEFISVPENLRAHRAFFTDLTYEQAVQTIADADLRRIAENLPPDAILLTEETKAAAWSGTVLNSEIIDINLKRLEHNPKLAEVNSEDDGEYEEIEVEDEEEQKRWDCETILTTYSNLENHPRLISESITLKGLAKKRKQQIQLSQRSGLPIGVIPVKKKPEKEEESDDEYTDDDGEEEVEMNEGRARPKKETKEEKALRKKMVKQMKQEKRSQKKALKQAFKSEEKEQTKILTQQQGSRKVVVKY